MLSSAEYGSVWRRIMRGACRRVGTSCPRCGQRSQSHRDQPYTFSARPHAVSTCRTHGQINPAPARTSSIGLSYTINWPFPWSKMPWNLWSKIICESLCHQLVSKRCIPNMSTANIVLELDLRERELDEVSDVFDLHARERLDDLDQVAFQKLLVQLAEVDLDQRVLHKFCANQPQVRQTCLA